MSKQLDINTSDFEHPLSAYDGSPFQLSAVSGKGSTPVAYTATFEKDFPAYRVTTRLSLLKSGARLLCPETRPSSGVYARMDPRSLSHIRHPFAKRSKFGPDRPTDTYQRKLPTGDVTAIAWAVKNGSAYNETDSWPPTAVQLREETVLTAKEEPSDRAGKSGLNASAASFVSHIITLEWSNTIAYAEQTPSNVPSMSQATPTTLPNPSNTLASIMNSFREGETLIMGWPPRRRMALFDHTIPDDVTKKTYQLKLDPDGKYSAVIQEPRL
jgi:hypothetical protein